MSPKKVLLADDEMDVIRVVSARLKDGGYQVISAGDGEEALRLAKEERPDIVILDIMMPKLDGYKVCRLLKFDHQYKTIVVMMLTARAQPEDMKLAAECGADAYMTKPVDFQEFLTKIAQLLAAKEKPAGS